MFFVSKDYSISFYSLKLLVLANIVDLDQMPQNVYTVCALPAKHRLLTHSRRVDFSTLTLSSAYLQQRGGGGGGGVWLVFLFYYHHVLERLLY